MAKTAQELRQERGTLVGEATGILEAVGNEGRALKTEERESFDGLEARIAEMDGDIERMARQERRVADLAKSQGRSAGPQDGEPGDGEPDDEKRSEIVPVEDIELMSEDERREYKRERQRRGRVLGRMVRALAAGKGDPARAATFASREWGEKDAAHRALAATDFTAGGAIVPDEYSASVIELLRPRSIVRRLNPTIVPMGSGTLRMPKIAGGATAGYIGENENAGKTEQSFGQVTLTFRKLAALVPVSNDMLRYSTPNADTIVRDDLVGAMGQRSDLAFIRGAGTEHSPKGIRHWAPAANVIGANSTVNLANVTTDLGKLWLALADADVRFTRPGWMFSPRTFNYLMTVRDTNGNFAFRDELLRGSLMGFPFEWTTQIPSNLGDGSDESEVYLVDFADVVIGEAENLMLDASTEAAYHDGASVVSAFGRDQTVVRAIAEHDLALRHDASVAVLNEVTWGA